MIRAAALAILLTACTSIQPAPPIAGSEWRVTAINGRATPPPPTSYRMRFEHGRLGGQFGCNHFGGDYSVRDDILTTGAVAMTEMACSEPADTFEGWGLAIIQRPMQVVWHETSRITLSNETGSIDLQR